LILLNLDTFKAAVDATTPTLDKSASLEDLYRRAGLPLGNFRSRDEALTGMRKKIKDAFTAGHRTLVDHCVQLRRELVLQHFLEARPVEPYLGIIERIIDAMRGTEATATPIEGDWQAAIQTCVDLQSFDGPYLDSDLHFRYKREVHFANAIKYLEKKGLLKGRKPGEYPLTAEQDIALAKAIEKMVLHMGGINLARKIFQSLQNQFDQTQLRYHYVDRLSPINCAPPRAPYAYLLHHAAKHPHGKKPLRSSPQNWKELLEVSTAYASLYEVQPFSIYENMFHDHVGLIPYLQRVSLRDALFSLNQMRSSDVVRMTAGILDGMVERGKLDGQTRALADPILSVIAAIQQVVGEKRGPVMFRLAEVIRSCPEVPPAQVRQILDQILTHDASGANSRFSRPSDAPDDRLPREERLGPDFVERPLLPNDTVSYLLLEHALCAPAFVEATLNQVRGKVSNFDEKAGFGVEAYIIKQLKSQNIEVKFGQYILDGKQGECDLIIETQKRIIFIEVKKKALTRASRAGSDVSILIDLAGSLMHAQLQAGWHEIRLRRHGEMTLTDNKGRTLSVIRREGRDVERIALSMNDYGGFQDRVLLAQVLNAQLSHQYNSVDPYFQTRLSKVNAQIAELRQQTQAIYEMEGKPENPHYFFNCWFLSVPQFLVLLDGVSNAEELERALWNTRHISTGSQDFYSDHAFMKEKRVAFAQTTDNNVLAHN
jgi:hypothetical protein